MRRSILFMAAVVVVALPGTAMALGVADIDYSVPLTPNDVPNVGAWFVGREAGTNVWPAPSASSFHDLI